MAKRRRLTTAQPDAAPLPHAARVMPRVPRLRRLQAMSP